MTLNLIEGFETTSNQLSQISHCMNNQIMIETLTVGAWRSLEARLLWEQEVGGSNPLAPTNLINKIIILYCADFEQNRRFCVLSTKYLPNSPTDGFFHFYNPLK